LELFKGPHRILIEEILVWIKMLMQKQGMLPTIVEMEEYALCVGVRMIGGLDNGASVII
jgi:hypothetical protein